ncbi:putative ABC transport system ATP-binding protein [Friedmanniella endophytica]|uniref:Putative ABC transport system ATP-binding protein n=1 Tax=Microlunatus kandeliicorticis TaxID=1759536 RepID=A0A7W3IPJ7_9ACTN|nr:ABC transporter ATP-binding protein [Microlunatus kandeliicorticis]MBA8792830.1 putative ABC transport system ATP-binding protein [Microlunatus kandeliicorticis]
MAAGPSLTRLLIMIDTTPTTQPPTTGHRSAPVISGRGLTMTYGSGPSTVHALAGVDLDVHPGSLAVMGPSGSGKTSLLHCLAGIVRPSSGHVQYQGTDLTTLSDRLRTRLRRDDFGFVFQSGQLLAELPANENVALPLMLGGLSLREAVGRADVWLGRLGLAGMERRRPGELSGGQLQRVAIARALVTEPRIVFADEPTGALDQRTGAEVMGLLEHAVVATGAALVVVTHDPGVARTCARTVTMADGRIVAEHHRPQAATAVAR